MSTLYENIFVKRQKATNSILEKGYNEIEKFCKEELPSLPFEYSLFSFEGNELIENSKTSYMKHAAKRYNTEFWVSLDKNKIIKLLSRYCFTYKDNHGHNAYSYVNSDVPYQLTYDSISSLKRKAVNKILDTSKTKSIKKLVEYLNSTDYIVSNKQYNEILDYAKKQFIKNYESNLNKKADSFKKKIDNETTEYIK